MVHCDEIVALAISERIGGPDGHKLLLASVKSSLPFSFLNGASSYAGFCTRLLLEHYQAGLFHINFKQAFYTQPYNDGEINFGLDTLREIDHRSAKKCIRPGATLETILPKMSTVDKQIQLHKARKNLVNGESLKEEDLDRENNKAVKSSASKYLDKKLSKSDQEHISRTIKLIVRQKAFSIDKDPIPRNIYHSKRPQLSTVILDRNTSDVGIYLIHKYACDQQYLGLSKEDYPSTENLSGPRELINRVKKNRSVTIKRTTCKPKETAQTDRDKEEKKRTAKVKKLSKVIDCMSSSKNTCQAILKPDGSKNTTNKSLGVKKALTSLTKKCIQTTDEALIEDDLLLSDFSVLPEKLQNSTVLSIVEFAGTKFKVFASTGQQYLDYVSNVIEKKLLKYMPNLKQIIICEEKYAFTPDDLKANTRQKRQQKEKVTISHLKSNTEIVSQENFSKQAIVSTSLGKSVISRYLASKVSQMKIKADLAMIIDSEAYMSQCECSADSHANCSGYTTPLKVTFTKEQGFVKEELMTGIKQKKGEAEMSQVDWLLDATILEEMDEGKAVINYVTSADIDTVVIHILTASQFWPRKKDGAFCNPLYVMLQKKKPELYNITGLLTLFEKTFQNRNIGLTIACTLAIGGNDFLPNFHSISHDTLLTEVMKEEALRNNLFGIEQKSNGAKRFFINNDLYLELMTRLYCPPAYDYTLLSFEEIRQISIKPPKKEFRHPQKWMPPKSALSKLTSLIQCQLDYFGIIGQHEAKLPDFLSMGCLQKVDGTILIDLGPDAFVANRNELVIFDEEDLLQKLKSKRSKQERKKPVKRRLLDTPQKGKSGKRTQIQSTPRKTKTAQDDQTVDNE